MKIKTVVFDWSGVISDDIEAVYDANTRILNQYGIPQIPFEIFKQNSTMTPREFLKGLGIKDDPEELFKLYTQYFSESHIKPKVFPDVKDSLSFLKSKNKNIVIVSSHPEENLKAEIKEYGLDGFISLVFGSVKNKVDVIKSLLKDLRIPSNSMLYVGDTIYDIKAAKEAGINSAAVLTGYHSEDKLKKENPDLLINNIGELRHFID